MSRNALLTPTPGTVTPGQYGNDSNTPQITVDQFGRVIAITTVATSGAGAAGTTTGTYAGRGAASSSGALYFPSDSSTIQRANGSAWVHWGPMYYLNMSKAVADFAWINQETATATDTKGGIVMTPPVGTGSSINLLKKSAPATPYTITIGAILNAVGTNTNRLGLCFRQSSDGKLVYVGVGYAASNYKVESYKFTDPTTYSGATYFSYDFNPYGGLIWLRIGDNGTNRYTYVSCDGQNFVEIHSVSRTDYLTADEVGIAVDCNNASIICVANFLHYVEA